MSVVLLASLGTNSRGGDQGRSVVSCNNWMAATSTQAIEKTGVLEKQIESPFALSSRNWLSQHMDVILIELNAGIKFDLEAIGLEIDLITDSCMIGATKSLDGGAQSWS